MADRDHYTADAVRAVLEAARHERDFADWLTHAVLVPVAGQLGSSAALTAGRSGSWEAAPIQNLLASAVGSDDEYLPPPMRKLTDMKAREIRDAALYGEGARQEIADQYGVSLSTVNDIAAGRTWAWLAEEDSRGI